MKQSPSPSDSGFGALFWQWVRRPRWSVAAPLLLVAFTGVFAWQIFLSPSAVEQGLTELNAAYRAARPLEARFAGFSYAPYASGGVTVNDRKFKRAESLLFTQSEKLQTPAAWHALGKLLLAQGKFDEAIQRFEAALKSDPRNASLHNDLGAARLEKAGREPAGQAADDFAQSRAHLEQAIKLDGQATEPLFNWALLQHRQGFREQAAEGWQTYLKNDARTGWATEAQQYLSELRDKQKVPLNK